MKWELAFTLINGLNHLPTPALFREAIYDIKKHEYLRRPVDRRYLGEHSSPRHADDSKWRRPLPSGTGPNGTRRVADLGRSLDRAADEDR